MLKDKVDGTFACR